MAIELALILTTPQLIILIATGLSSVIILAILFQRYIKNEALTHIIKPHFKALGYTIEKAEFTGVFSNGDFPVEFRIGGPIMDSGSPFNITCIYLFLKPINQEKTIRITAKINTVFSSIRKVEYSKKLPNLNN